MITLICPSNQPIKPDKSFADCFVDLMGGADQLKLATGYVSEDSLLFLRENLDENPHLKCDLIVGMCAYGGITKTLYTEAVELCGFLEKHKRGTVSACKAFPYHGKSYCFYNDSKPIGSILGSANLTQLIPTRQRNISVKILDPAMLLTADSHHETIKKACESFSTWTPKSFLEPSSLLKDCIGVDRVSLEQYQAVLDQNQPMCFLLPLKAEKKSNLNICFGKGRKNTRKGIITPRSWLDALDNQLGNTETERNISLEEARSIISQIQVEEHDPLSPDLIISQIDALEESGHTAQCHLIIRVNRNIGKGTGTLLAPDDRSLTHLPEYRDRLVLVMYRVNGAIDKGWAGQPLWIPNIKYPDGINYYFLKPST